MRKIFLKYSFILYLLISFNGIAQPIQSKVFVIDDFENTSLLGKWEGPVSLTSEFTAHGKSCLKLQSLNGNGLWLQTESILRDWSSFETLKFDIYNPSENLYYGTIQISDELGTDDLVEFKGQSYKGQKLFLNADWNHFEFLLQNAYVEEGDRKLALDKIRKIRFSFGSVNHPIYIDNIRLVIGNEGKETVSNIHPNDCYTIIDNRYVYPSLAGPTDKIEVSSKILNLRKQATTAIEELEKEIELADMQGYQTLYERIPLIVANIGMGIRSKLVWFQNEKDETEILIHIINSCTNTTKELQVLLSAQKSEMPVFAPENDASPNPLYVPPYPPLKELTIKDGFYRDKTGKPVMILSMLQLNEGPLMDYFAPFNHRIESYTVGGGSRYNIESSPVYRAFHKYPDAKRVGWDGWCGHLIKDRWAMGGKKEDVVICLESDHIKEAILEYLQLHYREWIENPNLLYNIMAYELQYICYCDKSQQMFRDWLEKKYSTIDKINDTWNTKYKSFADIEAPASHNAQPLSDVNRAAWYDWSDFNTRRFTDYLKWVKEEMRKFDPKTPICAGGTSSMLGSSNSVTGIDEEMIINEVDDVILNESGGSQIFSDLLLSLSGERKVMVDPEMGGDAHNILLHFLHGKSDISKWWWAGSPSKEYLSMNQSSIPHSKNISLANVDEVLRLGLDIRRLSSEIAEFTKVGPEIAILYSKSSILQVPPNQIQSGTTPYLSTLRSVWEGSRYLGCRIGFVSEKQVLDGKLNQFKLLIVPAAKYMNQDVVLEIKNYVQNGGTALIIPESFIFDQYAHENNKIADFGIKIKDVTLPSIVGVGEREQNYDQSFSQEVRYKNIKKTVTTLSNDIFKYNPMTLISEGLVQTIENVGSEVLARFDDGNAAITLTEIGNGKLYYLATTFTSADYHQIFAPLIKKLGLNRPIIGLDKNKKLIEGVEVRAVERELDYLVYASNLTADSVEFDLNSEKPITAILDLRGLQEIEGKHIKLEPYQEMIYKIKK